MNKIPDADAEKLKELYQNVLGKPISTDEARDRGQRLLVLAGFLARSFQHRAVQNTASQAADADEIRPADKL